MIDTLSDILEQPGVKHALESKIVKKQTEKFNLFLESVFVKLLNKVVNKFKRIFTWTNLILINLVVISYYAGRSNSENLSEWWNVFSEFDLYLEKTILINAFYAGLRFLKHIVLIVMKISLILIVIFLLYKLVKWIWFKLFPKDIELKQVSQNN